MGTALVAALGLTGCDDGPVTTSGASEPDIAGTWNVTSYRVTIDGSQDDLAFGSRITATFTSRGAYSFTYDDPPGSELAEGTGTYVQDESRNKLTLTGHRPSGEYRTTVYDYTFDTSSVLRLEFSRDYFEFENG